MAVQLSVHLISPSIEAQPTVYQQTTSTDRGMLAKDRMLQVGQEQKLASTGQM